jgi:L-2-hydroxycarboxylate dehydrogenase (NAD+)
VYRTANTASPTNTMKMAASKISVAIPTLRSHIRELLVKQGNSASDSEIITDVLMYAELRGNNQGIVKLVAGALRPDPQATEIRTVFESPVSAKIDGGQRIGMCVVHNAVDVAINKANTTGIAVVGCSNYSSATGALGVWARKIARSGHIAIVMSQCPEMVAPHGSYEPIFGTNPFAIAVPTTPRPVVLDMATSASAWYGLVTAKEEGKKIPDDIAYDAIGEATTDPAAALGGALRVFDRSYKGSHIALMIELLAGAFTGGDMADKKAKKNWGSLVIAINPSTMGPGSLESFQEQAQIMCNRVKNAKLLPSEQNPILLPGERGDDLEEQHLEMGTLELSAVLFEDLLRKLNE